MFRFKSYILVLVFLFAIVVSGCGLSEKASNLKDDIINITTDQISQQLENSLNQEFPGKMILQ